MNDRKIISNFLLEIAKNSHTEVLEGSKIDKEIVDSAKKMGLIIPSPDFAIFKTKWADIDKENLNKVRLPRKAVEDGIQTLVGKNLNFEHKGAYNVCGFCLSVKITKDEIECIQVFYKSLYPDEFENLKEKIKNKEAAVSFEIYNVDEKGNSVIKQLDDGTKEITKIHCHGTGLLMVNPPACPTAKIFKLVAKNLTDAATKELNKVFSPDLIYAGLALEETEEASYECQCLKCGKVIISEKHCKDIKCPACGGDMRRKDKPGNGQPTTKSNEVKVEIKQIESKIWICPHCEKEIGEKELFLDENQKWYHRPCQDKGEIILPKENSKKEEKLMVKCEKCGKEFEAAAEEKLCAECVALSKESSEETKPAVKPEETQVVAPEAQATEKVEEKKEAPAIETKPVETKGEETKEGATQAQTPVETIVPKIVVKVARIYSDVFVDTYKDGTMSGISEGKSKSTRITEYADGTKDEVVEESEYKKKYTFSELEAAVNAAKEELINLHKVELETKTSEVKVALEQKITEKETELANLKKELEKKSQEQATEAIPEGSRASLEVGNVEETKPTEDKETADRAKEIDKIIASKHDKS
jgi:Zn finger protein HypA/HybF involved in hydrogenase expression